MKGYSAQTTPPHTHTTLSSPDIAALLQHRGSEPPGATAREGLGQKLSSQSPAREEAAAILNTFSSLVQLQVFAWGNATHYCYLHRYLVFQLFLFLKENFN